MTKTKYKLFFIFLDLFKFFINLLMKQTHINFQKQFFPIRNPINEISKPKPKIKLTVKEELKDEKLIEDHKIKEEYIDLKIR